MRILDGNNNELNEVLLMLTPEEAFELSSKIRSLNIDEGDHNHINDRTYQREITVAIYTPENKNNFAEEIVKILETEN